jgi:type IX secretion system PorP/SprF family membrane protein
LPKRCDTTDFGIFPPLHHRSAVSCLFGKMRYVTLLILFCMHAVSDSTAQQVASMYRYNFAPALYNPAANSLQSGWGVQLLHRSQWIGVEGAPQIQGVATQWKMIRTALGFNAQRIKTGPLQVSGLNIAYAYTLPLSADWQLHAGISAGMGNWNADWRQLNLSDNNDQVFTNELGRWRPNFGAGLLFTAPYISFGLGMPQITEHRLRKGIDTEPTARSYRRYYAQVQGRWLIGADWLVQPQLMLHNSGWLNALRDAPYDQIGSPTAIDIGSSVTLRNQWTAGLSWRTAVERSASSDHALSIAAGWLAPTGQWQVQAVYDYSLNALRRVSGGSFELMLGYRLGQSRSSTPPQQPGTSIPVAPTAPTATPKPSETDMPDDEPVARYLQGIVFDMRTGLPAEGARVTLSNNCGQGETAAYITGPDGRYRFRLEPDCCYTATAQMDALKNAISPSVCTTKALSAQIFQHNLELVLP